MKEENKTTNLLESQHVSLTREKKDSLWKAIEADITAAPIPSPFLFSFITKKPMASIALALVLMLGVGGTVYASNEARPGDILFPIDQALEEVRLALASNDESRARLQIANAEERLEELRSILAENSEIDTSVSTGTASTSIVSFEAEADVFTDTTLVEVEMNDRKTMFETTADTRDEVIDEIVDRFDIDRATVEQVLDFEIEDRASRIQDFVTSDDDRVTKSLDLIDKSVSASVVSDAERSRLLAELVAELYGSADRVRIDDDRIEIRDGNERIEIREKDGETEIKIKSNDDDGRQNDDNSNNSNAFEAEADVFTDTTLVEVEMNDRKTMFETTADTRDEVIDEIVDRFDIDRATVEQVLDFEIEDRASRADDSEDDSGNRDDDSDDSSSDSRDDSDSRVRIEVRVEDGEAEVRMEYNGKKDEFDTSYSDRATLITQLANRSNLSESVITSSLDLEIKNRASRTDDSEDDSGDQADDSDDRRDDDSDDSSSDSLDDSDSRVRIEVRVEEGEAEVRMEYNGKKDEFDTSYSDRATLITQLANRSNLSESVITSSLDLEIRD